MHANTHTHAHTRRQRDIIQHSTQQTTQTGCIVAACLIFSLSSSADIYILMSAFYCNSSWVCCCVFVCTSDAVAGCTRRRSTVVVVVVDVVIVVAYSQSQYTTINLCAYACYLAPGACMLGGLLLFPGAFAAFRAQTFGVWDFRQTTTATVCLCVQ